MIVGVAQLVLNVADLQAASERYVADGWTASFRCDAIPNHPLKRPLQASERSALDMVHLAKPGTRAVELTSYADGPPAGDTVYTPTREGVRIAACEAQASERFWSALGFARRPDGALDARAVLPAWRLSVVLDSVQGPRPQTSLDAAGWVLVTVLTTAIQADLERLTATGLLVQSAGPWDELIAERQTTVALVKGPSGELVELLQAPRTGRDERPS